MPPLPLEQIQGFILRSYAMDSLRLFVLRVADPISARRALGKVPVTSGAIWDRKPDACVNVALTFDGLTALGLSEASLASFPEEFRQGAVARAASIGDTGNSAPASWKPAFTSGQAHVLVTLFAQNQALREQWTAQLRSVWRGALEETLVQDADVLPGNLAHFG